MMCGTRMPRMHSPSGGRMAHVYWWYTPTDAVWPMYGAVHKRRPQNLQDFLPPSPWFWTSFMDDSYGGCICTHGYRSARLLQILNIPYSSQPVALTTLQILLRRSSSDSLCRVVEASSRSRGVTQHGLCFRHIFYTIFYVIKYTTPADESAVGWRTRSEGRRRNIYS